MSLRFRFVASCVLATCLSLTACGSDGSSNKPADAGVPDAANQPVVGGKLGAAIASAAAATTATAKAKAASDGDQPPENGVFAPGEADRRYPLTAPPKLDVLAEGSEPRVALAHKLDAPEQKVALAVSLRSTQQRIALEFGLAVKPDKPKADDKPKEGAASTKMVATVTAITLPQGVSVPKEVTDQLNKLKGTIVRYDFTADGAASNYVVEAPKDAGAGLDQVLGSLTAALSAAIVPLPSKPVGKDAYWIVQDRSRTALGLSVVRFRVVRLTALDAGVASLSVEVRQYSADNTVKLDTSQGAQTELNVAGFDSQGKGTTTWKSDTFLPSRCDVSERLAAQVMLGSGPQARGLRLDTELSVSIGGGAAAPSPSAAPSQKK